MIQGEQFGRRQPNGEADHVVPLGEGQQIAHQRVLSTRSFFTKKLRPRQLAADGRRDNRLGLAHHHGPTAHVGVDKPVGPQLVVGGDHRAAVDTEGLGQPALGWQAETVRQRAPQDHTAHLPHNLAVDGHGAGSVDGKLHGRLHGIT